MITEGWIKIDRNLLKWRWFTDGPTLIVWIYLLLQANYEERDFKTLTIRRGELVRSQAQIAADTGLSLKSVRTALEHLEATGEVARRRHGKNVVISIPNYDRYQDNRQDNGRITAGWRQDAGTDVRKKERKKERREGGAQRPSPAPKMSAYEFALRKSAELAAAGDDEEDDDE